MKILFRFTLLIIMLGILSGCGAKIVTEDELKYEVTVYNRNQSFYGYNIFADNTVKSQSKIVKVSLGGRLMWSYDVPSKLYGGDKSPNTPVTDVELLENGNIMFVVNNIGIFEINEEGELVWQYKDDKVSNDADRLANGHTLYVRGAAAKGENTVVEIDADGNEVWSWDGEKRFNEGKYAGVSGDDGRWLDVTSAQRTKVDTTVVTLKNLAIIAEIDMAGDVVRIRPVNDGYDMIGSEPYDVEITKDDNFLVALGAVNMAAEYSRYAKQPQWIWNYPKKRITTSMTDANRLPNGNTLMATTDAFLEVDEDGEIVWMMSVRGSAKGSYRNLYKIIRVSGEDGKVYGQ